MGRRIGGHEMIAMFKKGGKVKCIDNYKSFEQLIFNGIYTVENVISSGTNITLYLSGNGINSNFGWSAHRFVVIEDEIPSSPNVYEFTQIECDKCKKSFFVNYNDANDVFRCPFCYNEDKMQNLTFDPNFKIKFVNE
jgi:hypothetical protein